MRVGTQWLRGLPNRTVFDTFLYGDGGTQIRTSKRSSMSGRANPATFAILEVVFKMPLVDVLQVIDVVASCEAATNQPAIMAACRHHRPRHHPRVVDHRGPRRPVDLERGLEQKPCRLTRSRPR